MSVFAVPQAAQEKLPKGVEQAVPDSLHDTGSSKDISGGDSIVPKAVAESLPKGVQEAVPDAMWVVMFTMRMLGNDLIAQI